MRGWYRNSTTKVRIQRFDDRVMQAYGTSMGMTVDKIAAEALALPPQARAFVAEKLIESLDEEAQGELSPAWKAELLKRCREVDEGLVELHAAEDVFRKAYSSLR
jgi:putative addiction module component (TIGR02574 family)